MTANTLPTDSNSKPAEGLFDPITGHVIAAKSGTVATTGGGTEYAPTVVNVADPTTPANQLAVNSLGQIAVSNFPAVQSVIGTVSVAQFPSMQTVSGSVDVADRASRQLGHVIIDLGGAGTNTAPGYAVIQDGTTNSHKMAVNADGSLNVTGTISASNPSVGSTGGATPTSATLVGATDGTDLQPFHVTGAGALKVDASATVQPVSGTFWQATQPVSGSVSVSNLPTTQSVNLAQIAGSAIGNTNPAPTQDIEQSGYVSATTPPSTTNAGSDTAYTFSAQVSRVIIQNNTSSNVNYAFDTTASAGSLLLVPGAMLVYPKKCTVLHLYTASAQSINGTSSGGIVVLGAL
jgi:hypothetical protein